jgi:ribonuclease Z
VTKKLSVTFLGTSSATPTKNRSMPAIAVKREGEVILMDCGEGIQTQILKYGVGMKNNVLILITHLHGDHLNGLIGLLQTMSMSQRATPLTIVGPAPLLRWLQISIEVLHIGLTFELKFVAAKPGTVFRSKEYSIRATRARHSVDTFAFLLEEHARPGIFDPQRAKRLGIPEGKKWSNLQHGRTVVVGGKMFRPADVMGESRLGRKVGYSGDTRPTESLARFFRGSDLLIFDSTFSPDDQDKAKERMHSTSVEAAELSRKANVRKLVLTHFSARYKRVESLLREARKIMPETVAAVDGLTLEVQYSDRDDVSSFSERSASRSARWV